MSASVVDRPRAGRGFDANAAPEMRSQLNLVASIECACGLRVGLGTFWSHARDCAPARERWQVAAELPGHDEAGR